MVDEQTAGGVDVVRLQCYVSHIPDALYMVEDNAPHQPTYAPPTTVDVVAAAIPGENALLCHIFLFLKYERMRTLCVFDRNFGKVSEVLLELILGF